jgi:hypothetical protein
MHRPARSRGTQYDALSCMLVLRSSIMHVSMCACVRGTDHETARACGRAVSVGVTREPTREARFHMTVFDDSGNSRPAGWLAHAWKPRGVQDDSSTAYPMPKFKSNHIQVKKKVNYSVLWTVKDSFFFVENVSLAS